MMMYSIAVLSLLAPLVTSTSISTCGQNSDHFKNVKVATDPSDPKKAKHVTLTVMGDLDEDLDAGTLSIDLHIKIFGKIKENLKKTVPFTLSPVLAKGTQSLQMGPFDVPSIIRGEIEVKGRIALVNGKNEPVTCIDLNMLLNEGEVAEEAEQAACTAGTKGDCLADNGCKWCEAGAVPSACYTEEDAKKLPPAVFECSKQAFEVGQPLAKNCGSPQDHMKFHSSSASGVTTVTGTLDEPLTSMKFIVDARVKFSFFHKTFSLNIPAKYSPGLGKGDFKITIGKPKSEEELAEELAKVQIGGHLKMQDPKGEQVFCFEAGSSAAVSKPESITFV